jgi:hypothetical protein
MDPVKAFASIKPLISDASPISNSIIALLMTHPNLAVRVKGENGTAVYKYDDTKSALTPNWLMSTGGSPTSAVVSHVWRDDAHDAIIDACRDELLTGETGAIKIVGRKDVDKAGQYLLDYYNELKNFQNKYPSPKPPVDLEKAAQLFVNVNKMGSIGDKFAGIMAAKNINISPGAYIAKGSNIRYEKFCGVTAAANKSKAIRKVIKYLDSEAEEVGFDEINGLYGEFFKQIVAKSISGIAGLSEITTSDMVHAWAETSLDHSSLSWAIQEIAGRLCNTPIVHHDLEEPQRIHITSDSDIERFVRGQYAATQQHLDSLGIKQVRLFRGLKLPNNVLERVLGGRKNEGLVNVAMRPLSSWSTDSEVANSFSMGSAEYDTGTGVILECVFPRDRIFSCATTGFGCYAEKEVVTIGSHPDDRCKLTVMGMYGDGPLDDSEEWDDE